MRRLIPALVALAVVLLLPAIAAAQDARVNGQVFDRDGKPWAGISVVLKSDSGRTYSLKTDKDGRFTQIGLSPGVYTFTFTSEADQLNYAEKHQVASDQDNSVVVNFKEILEKISAAHPEENKQQQEAVSQFKGMKAHVDAGLGALNDSEELRKQLRAAPADQKGPIQDKLNADYKTAISELQLAEQAISAKDTKNHAVIFSNLGVAYNLSGRYDEGITAYQKAIDLNPQPNYYTGLSSSLANSAAALTDPAAMSAKIAEAGADCDKAAALDPATPGITARCWKNIGIVLSNKGNFKDALPALEKSSQADPKDAQTLFLIGGAYTGLIETKQEGDKITYIIPPGAAEAYQKCIDLDPNGPYAAQAKQNLDALAAMSGGDSTTTGTRKPKKKK